MTEKINGRTPEDIKRELKMPCADTTKCVRCTERYYCNLEADALAYIHQLEARIDTLTAKAALFDDAVAAGEKMKRERDAAVEDVKSLCATNYFTGNYCKYCKYNEPDGQCHHHCIPYSAKMDAEAEG